MLQNMIGLAFFWYREDLINSQEETCRGKKYLMSVGCEMCTAGKDTESKVFTAWWNTLAVKVLVLVGCLRVAV